MEKKTLYTAEGSIIKGDVTFGDHCSVWFNAVVRADAAKCTIGDNTNIQDLVMIHTGRNVPVTIGNNVSIGHSAIIHGCTIGDDTIVGMGAIVMDHAVIGKECMVAAGALVTQNKQFPDGSLIMGSPAKQVRMLTEEERRHLRENALLYVQEAQEQLPKTEI